MTNKKLWQGTEACWRHSHNDVGDCGDDSFQTLTPPPPPRNSPDPARPRNPAKAQVLCTDWRTFEV